MRSYALALQCSTWSVDAICCASQSEPSAPAWALLLPPAPPPSSPIIPASMGDIKAGVLEPLPPPGVRGIPLRLVGFARIFRLGSWASFSLSEMFCGEIPVF